MTAVEWRSSADRAKPLPMRRWLSGLALAATLAACGGDDGTSGQGGGPGSGAGGTGGGSVGGGGEGAGGGGLQTTFGGDRPVELRVPSGYAPGEPAPLLILLHGYSANATLQEGYFLLEAAAHERGMLYAVPEGLVDGMGNQYWNAGEACCDFFSSMVDDAAYLRGLIDEIRGVYDVDPKRIFFAGHSNGGFMSHRMACDHADVVAGIVSLAGAMDDPPAACSPSEAVSVLQVHGTMDETIVYEGGDILGNPYTSAASTVAFWAEHNGCDATTTDDPTALDLDTDLAGAETAVSRHEGCAGGEAELWTIQDGTHIPALGDSWAPTILDFLMAHPKP